MIRMKIYEASKIKLEREKKKAQKNANCIHTHTMCIIFIPGKFAKRVAHVEKKEKFPPTFIKYKSNFHSLYLVIYHKHFAYVSNFLELNFWK